MIYFDNAATTMIKPPEVKQAVDYAMTNFASVGRSGYKYSIAADDMVYDCRENIAALFNFDKPENIVFTQNATHALNIAIKSLVRRGDKVLISGFEHNAVLRPLYALGANIAVFGNRLFDRDYTIASFKRNLTNNVKCVIICHISNVFGFIQPVKEIAEICAKRRIPLIIDASQSAGIADIDAGGLGAEFIAMPGHKSLYGPQGTGVLLCKKTTAPLLFGGTGSASKDRNMPEFLPDRLEAGTHNTPGIAGLNEGVKFVMAKGTDKILSHEMMLKDAFIKELTKNKKIELFGAADSELQSGVISFKAAGVDCETVGEKLGNMDICVRSGFHCAPIAHKSAGTYDSGTVRVSFGVFNTEEEVLHFCDVMRYITAFS